MTRLVVPYNDESYPFASLANWSCTYPFKVDGKEYPSVNHYVYCRLTLHEDDARLLSIRANDPALRFMYNVMSNDLYYRLFRGILPKGIRAQYHDTTSSSVRDILQRHPSHYYFYITNDDVMWGINNQGYGFNLIGQAYARIIDPDHSYFYHPLNASTLYPIYVASVLCQHHLQEGHDILPWIGKSVEEIGRVLGEMYPDVVANIPLSSKEVHDRYQRDPFFSFLQYEIDYPWNLAGFVRQAYADKLNYYLRRRFHRLMILAYFRHVLSQKYGDVIDLGRLEAYAQHQLSKLSDEQYQALADKLYRLYNDPDTTSKTSAFLTPEVRQQLYDTEIQFLGNQELINASTYVPFLYHIKPGMTTYIYDDNHGFTEELEPFTKLLSPFQYNPLTMNNMQFEDLASFAFTRILHEWTHASMENAFKTFRVCVDMSDYQESLNNSIRAFKRLLITNGMTLKFRASALARYELYNTHSYGYDIQILDPDPTFELQSNKELMVIRTKLETDPMYGLTYSISTRHVPQLQDRIRFRIQDFVHTFEAYRRFCGKEKLDAEDYQKLESLLYRDPPSASPRTTTTTLPAQFRRFFENLGDETMIQQLWKFFLGYNDILESYLAITPPDRPCTSPRVEVTGVVPPSTSDRAPMTIAAIVVYFVQHFYQQGEEMAFYLFTLSVLMGKHIHSFTPSLGYYNVETERELRKYLTVQDYEMTFLVNLMGVIGRLEKEMPAIRVRYFGYLTTTPFMRPKDEEETEGIRDSITRRLREMGYPIIERARDMTKRFNEKRRKNRKSKKEVEEEVLGKRRQQAGNQDEEEDAEDQVNLEELYEEYGMENDDDDDEGLGFGTDEIVI